MCKVRKKKYFTVLLSAAIFFAISSGMLFAGSGPFAKSGFITDMEDGYLWILKPNEEKSEKYIILVGAGPALMTIKAVNKGTAIEYLATTPGFNATFEDGYLWILRPGDDMSEKHVTLVGAGPMRTTVKALDKKTAYECLAGKPGFDVQYEDGYLWVLKPGDQMSEKHITLVGAGPMNLTVKALDKKTALEYLASKPGFDVEVEEAGRIWVFRSDGSKERSEKHVTYVGAGPLGSTLKALDSDTVVAYLASRN